MFAVQLNKSSGTQGTLRLDEFECKLSLNIFTIHTGNLWWCISVQVILQVSNFHSMRKGQKLSVSRQGAKSIFLGIGTEVGAHRETAKKNWECCFSPYNSPTLQIFAVYFTSYKLEINGSFTRPLNISSFVISSV